jgi:hypothetical protein
LGFQSSGVPRLQSFGVRGPKGRKRKAIGLLNAQQRNWLDFSGLLESGRYFKAIT